MTPSASPYPLPTPHDPSGTVVSIVFLVVLFGLVSLLWWQVRRVRRADMDLESGPWPSEGPPDAR
jgi:hypothetical protein